MTQEDELRKIDIDIEMDSDIVIDGKKYLLRTEEITVLAGVVRGQSVKAPRRAWKTEVYPYKSRRSVSSERGALVTKMSHTSFDAMADHIEIYNRMKKGEKVWETKDAPISL